MAIKVSEVQAQLADREAIRDTLMLYGRSIDRLDLSIATEIFWAGATDDHGGTFNGLVTDLLDAVKPLLEKMQVTQHFLMNMTIRIDGSTARTETYVVAYHELGADEAHALLIGGGRLLDVLTKNDDEWRISSRKLIIDWMKKLDNTSLSKDDLGGHVISDGRKSEDYSFQHFQSGASPTASN